MPETTKHNKDTVFEFPCQFSIKVMGEKNDAFETAVLSIIKSHVYNLKEDAIQTRLSKNKRYLSLTISFSAQSKKQLDTIYTELSACEHVLFTL